MAQNVIAIFSRFHLVFFEGLMTTLLLSALTVFFGTLLGSLVALCKMSKFKPLSLLVTAYIEVVRGTPLLLQLYVFFFMLPMVIGFDPGMFTSVLIALVLNSAAYVAEIIRAGIQAVDKGQSEAARSLGINSTYTMLKVILPQAVKNILPTLGNEFIMVIKETSLASVFFLGDLMTVAHILRGSLFMALEPLIVAGTLYFCVTFTLSKLVALYERRLASSD